MTRNLLGANFSFETLEQIIQRISLLPEPKPIEKQIRLWSNPWWGGLILFLPVIASDLLDGPEVGRDGLE